MTKEPIIRFVEKKDLKQLVNLCKLHTIFEKSEFNESGKEQEFNEHLFNNPALFCFVIELDNSLIGYATYMKQFSTWDCCFYVYMDCLFLTEKARGFGIGEKVINKIKLHAKKLDCKVIQWQTPDFNTRAIKFYDRIGGISKTKERYVLEV